MLFKVPITANGIIYPQKKGYDITTLVTTNPVHAQVVVMISAVINDGPHNLTRYESLQNKVTIMSQ